MPSPKKKSVALIIALLIITAVAIFAFTAAWSIVSSIARTSRDSDAMIADEAARAGLEYGKLMGCKNPTADKTWGNPDYNVSFGAGQELNVSWAISDQVSPWPGKGCEIISIANIANTYKQYDLKINGGFVQGDCTDPVNHCAGVACGTVSGNNGVCGLYSASCPNTCVAPKTCSGNTCVCNTYEGDTAFCAKYHATCGNVTGTDQCGNSRTVNCGTTCPIGQACSSSHTCVATCTAESNAAFCNSYGKNCGSYTNKDNCGNTRVANCGTCSSGTCTSNVCTAAHSLCWTECNSNPYYNGGSCAKNANACAASNRANIGLDHCTGTQVCCCDLK